MWKHPLLVCALLLGGCAALPDDLRTPPQQPLLPFAAAATAQPSGLARWGGEIVAVRNRAEGSEVEVVQFALNASGRPLKSDASGGRFLIKVAGFIDPAIHVPGRLVTALGRFDGRQPGRIGEQPYRFPVLEAESVHLWPEIKDPPAHCDCEPFFPGPFLMRPIILVPAK